MMKLLMLNAYFEPENYAFSHLEQDLLEAFVQANFSIKVITPSPTRSVSQEVIAVYRDKKLENKFKGAVQIQRFSIFQEGKNPLLRAVRYVLVNIIEYWKGIQTKDVDLILGASTPPTQGLLCALVKKRLKVPFVYNLQDIFPDSMVSSGMTREDTLLWRIGRKIEDFTYRNADQIIVISEGFKRNIMEKGVPKEKIVVIPNWVDENEVFPISRSENKLIARYNLDSDKFYISYCGNIGHTQNFEMLMDAAKQLEDQPDICFVVIGDGAFKPQLEAMVLEKSIKNVILLPFQPYEDIAHVFSLGDVGLVISKPGISVSSVPSKTWCIMAAGRPIVASFDVDSELCDVINDMDCGLCMEAGNTNAFCQGILCLKNNLVALEQMGKNGRKHSLHNPIKYDSIARYKKIVRDLATKRNDGSGL